MLAEQRRPFLRKLPVKAFQLAQAGYELRRAYWLLKFRSVDQLLARSGGVSLPVDGWQRRMGWCPPAPPLTAAIYRASRLVPRTHATCLIQSCAEARLRQRYGLRSILLIGFRSDEGGRLLGHAWLAYSPVAGKSAVKPDATPHTVTAVFEIGAAGR